MPHRWGGQSGLTQIKENLYITPIIERFRLALGVYPPKKHDLSNERIHSYT